MGVTAIYRIEASEGKADEFLAILRQGREFALTVEGCEGFEIFQGKDDPHRFVLLEHWTSPEAHDDHFDQNVRGAGVLEMANALLTSPFPEPTESRYLLREG